MGNFLTTIQSIQDEASGVKTFVLTKPNEFSFFPGQYCWLSLPDYDYEPSPMAIASGTDDDFLEFSVRSWGDLTNALFEKSPGDKVRIDGPHGTFFPVDAVKQGKKLYLIAGGTGITPARSLIKSLGAEGEKVLFYGAKNPSELLYPTEIPSWPVRVNLTVDQADETWEGNVGLVTHLLETEEFDKNALYFICGPKPMEVAVVNYLRENGISDEQIYVSLEKFDEEGNVVGPVLPTTHEQAEF